MSLLVFRQLIDVSGDWVRFARVAGVPFWKFFLKGLIPELKPQWTWWGFYFFILYFFSFSIPFLVGGVEYGGLEVFIYEKVMFLGKWAEAIQYSFVLFLIFILISFCLKKNDDFFNRNNGVSGFTHLLIYLNLFF